MLIYRERHYSNALLSVRSFRNRMQYLHVSLKKQRKQRMEVAQVINIIRKREVIFDPNLCALKVMALEFITGF
jgi:hypothetical protein